MRNIIASILIGLISTPSFANIFPSMGVDAYNQAPKIRTYSAGQDVLTVPYASPTDICMIGGVSGKIVKVFHVRVYGAQTTAGINGFFLVKRSTYDTGTATPLSVVPHDSYYLASGADVQFFAAAPTTLGINVGVIRGADVYFGTSAGLSNSFFDFDFGPNSGVQPIILHANEMLAVNFGLGTTPVPAGMKMSCEFVWTEE